MSSNAITPLSTDVDFEVLSSRVLERLKKREAESEWKNAAPIVAKVTGALMRMKDGGRTVTVQLAIPKEIAKALSEGTATRIGGRMVTTNSRFLKHLNEVKPSHVRKLLKSPMLAFVVLDALQSVLLNEKLAAIQMQLKEIDRKVGAQNQGLLRKAVEQMRDLHQLKDRNRRQRIHQIQDSLGLFEGIYTDLCESRWKTIDQLLQDYEGSRLTNDSERRKLCAAAQEVSQDIEMVANAKILHARMTVELGETQVAEQEVLRLQDFLLQQEKRFQAVFGETASIQRPATHRRLIGRASTARRDAQEQLIEPTERLDHLLNSSLLLHLALPMKQDTGG